MIQATSDLLSYRLYYHVTLVLLSHLMPLIYMPHAQYAADNDTTYLMML